MVDFDAYAADCRVHGQLEVGEGRLSDQLDHAAELLVRDARLEGMSDGRTVEMPELTIARDELCAVVANGPRGDTARRLHTLTKLVEVEVGPYLVVGRVHGTPASEPLGAALRRQAWVPLTEVTVMYRCGGSDVREEMTTLLVNRDLMRSFRAVEQASLDLLWEKHGALKDAASDATDSTEKPRKAARPRTKKAPPPASPKPPA
ncbi:MAG TPA: hypothetical protein VF361_08385 [Candidatus Limnocylindrales bacterium]